nr:hypothetical protein [Pseudomonas sp. Pdm06]
MKSTTLASAVNIGTFNLGNAMGAGLGLLMVLAFAWRSRAIATAMV